MGKVVTMLISLNCVTQTQTASLYLNLNGLGRAFQKVTTVCVEVLGTQPLAVKSAEQV